MSSSSSIHNGSSTGGEGAVESFFNSKTWDLKVRKQWIFVERVEEVETRIRRLSEETDQTAYGLLPYTEVRLTPLFLLVNAKWDSLGSAAAAVASFDLAPLKRGQTEARAQLMMRQLLQTVLFLHGHGILHGCIQLDCLRVTCAEKVFLLGHVLPLSLFALSSPYAREARKLAAPEVQRNERLTSGSDVWSMGVVLLQLLTHPGTEFCTEDLVDMDLLSPWLSACSPSVKSFLVQCFKQDPSGRPTLVELQGHAFLSTPHTPYDMMHANETGSNDQEQSAEDEEGEDDA